MLHRDLYGGSKLLGRDRLPRAHQYIPFASRGAGGWRPAAPRAPRAAPRPAVRVLGAGLPLTGGLAATAPPP